MDTKELRNLQEAYMDVYNPERLDEISQKTATRAYANSSTGEFEGQDSPRDVRRTDRLRGHIERKFGKKAAAHADRAAHSRTFGRKGAGGMPSVKEQVDLYDIILSHLLDEGYADTEESATAIMANMSEEWRESICEEYKKLPVDKMVDKIRMRSYSLGKSDIQQVGRPDSGNIRAGKEDERSDKMKDVLVNHKKKTSLRKSDANRDAGYLKNKK